LESGAIRDACLEPQRATYLESKKKKREKGGGEKKGKEECSTLSRSTVIGARSPVFQSFNLQGGGDREGRKRKKAGGEVKGVCSKVEGRVDLWRKWYVAWPWKNIKNQSGGEGGRREEREVE